MLAGLLTILAASLLGSLHCAGMCGAFLGIALGGEGSRVKTQGAYHLGRLLTYLVLGVVAGGVGRAVDMGSGLAGIRPVAAVLAGGTMVAFGGITLWRLMGGKFVVKPPGFLGRVAHVGYGVAMRRGPVVRAGMVGLLTTLLPCGWLYVFVAAAAGTASPVMGGLSMGVFWVGTLPVMVTLGAGLRGLTGAFGGRLQHVACVAMVVVGVWTVVGRAQVSPVRLLGRTPGVAGVVDQDEKPACCKETK